MAPDDPDPPIQEGHGRFSADDWAILTGLFGEALTMGRDERSAFLDRLHDREPLMADELASLLAAHENPDEAFLPDLPTRLAPAVDLCGHTIGAYRLTRLLGNGGMGAVYLAQRSDGTFLKQVAIKILPAPFAFARHRFKRERELLARLDHQSITRLLDGGTTTEGLPYLVMEYVDGMRIDEFCARNHLSLDERIDLLLQVCDGISHAHQNLIVHCDIKPENILVTGSGTVKLLDFGIAKLLDPKATVTMARPATPTYASPEQLRGDPVTTVSDVYAIGVLAYVLLTGSWPYRVQSGRLDEIVQAVLVAEPMRASNASGLDAARSHQLRGDLDTVLAKAVARDPNRRYTSVQQLADDLNACRRGYPIRARSDTFAYRMTKLVRRNRMTTAGVLCGIVGLVAAATISAREARVANRRFQELRQFAHTVVFEVNDSLTTVPGTTAARKILVETGLRYLDRLNQERVSDRDLQEELAAAYIRIGKVQGGAFLPNLGDSAGAVTSFRKAIATIGPAPVTAGLERLRIEAHINIGQLAVDPIRGGPEFDAAIAAAQRLLEQDPNDARSMRLYADALHGRATVAHVTDHADDHVRASLREIEVRQKLLAYAPSGWLDQLSLARAMAQYSLALGQKGDTAGSEAPLRGAFTIVNDALGRDPRNQMIARGVAEIRSRLGGALLGLGRRKAASEELEAAINLLDPLVSSDRNNVQYAADLAYARFRLGEVRQAEGRLDEAMTLQRLALAVRRDRLARDPGFMFVPWELTRSLNVVGEMLLTISPPRNEESYELFAEAASVAERTLALAPSFNEVRKQLALAQEGLARASLARGHEYAAKARPLLSQSLDTWQTVARQSSGDVRDTDRVRRVQQLLATLPAQDPAP